jgi:hypothetical protein
MPGLKWILAGGGLLWLARLFESVGDSFPHAAEGVSSGRLLFHSVALLIVLGAIFCFVRAGRVIWRVLRGEKPSPRPDPPRPTAPAPGPEAPAEFDPDAALARYLESKAAQPAAPPRPAPGGFGRKGA